MHQFFFGDSPLSKTAESPTAVLYAKNYFGEFNVNFYFLPNLAKKIPLQKIPTTMIGPFKRDGFTTTILLPNAPCSPVAACHAPPSLSGTCAASLRSVWDANVAVGILRGVFLGMADGYCEATYFRGSFKSEPFFGENQTWCKYIG